MIVLQLDTFIPTVPAAEAALENTVHSMCLPTPPRFLPCI